MKKIKLTTEDNLTIIGNYYQGHSNNAVICLHQFKSDKSSYDQLAQELNNHGYHVLAIDFRGHGESEGNYESFSDKNFIDMFLDANVAYDYLSNINTTINVHMIGASIGANIALQYQEMNTLNSVVALSPGLNYHGINPQDANMGNVATPILFLTSKHDKYVNETKELFEESSLPRSHKRLSIYSGEKHGVFIVDENNDALNEITLWIQNNS